MDFVRKISCIGINNALHVLLRNWWNVTCSDVWYFDVWYGGEFPAVLMLLIRMDMSGSISTDWLIKSRRFLCFLGRFRKRSCSRCYECSDAHIVGNILWSAIWPILFILVDCMTVICTRTHWYAPSYNTNRCHGNILAIRTRKCEVRIWILRGTIDLMHLWFLWNRRLYY
jgi:hypothetical protein